MNTIERSKMVKMSIQALVNDKTATRDSPERHSGDHSPGAERYNINHKHSATRQI